MWPRCSARRAHHACACGQECDHLLLNSSTGPCCSCSSSRMLADPARAPANHLVEVMTLRERAGRRSEWHARAWRLKPRCRRERAARARRVRGRSARQESAPLDSVQTSTSKRLERLSGSRNIVARHRPPSSEHQRPEPPGKANLLSAIPVSIPGLLARQQARNNRDG